MNISRDYYNYQFSKLKLNHTDCHYVPAAFDVVDEVVMLIGLVPVLEDGLDFCDAILLEHGDVDITGDLGKHADPI